MLKQVLKELAAGDVHSQADLARRLGVDEYMLKHMIQELAARGYLVSLAEATGVDSCSSSGCGGCKGCSGLTGRAASPKGWTLTEKGRRLAKA